LGKVVPATKRRQSGRRWQSLQEGQAREFLLEKDTGARSGRQTRVHSYGLPHREQGLFCWLFGEFFFFLGGGVVYLFVFAILHKEKLRSREVK
jgi:hypothetical protein